MLKIPRNLPEFCIGTYSEEFHHFWWNGIPQEFYSKGKFLTVLFSDQFGTNEHFLHTAEKLREAGYQLQYNTDFSYSTNTDTSYSTTGTHQPTLDSATVGLPTTAGTPDCQQQKRAQ